MDDGQPLAGRLAEARPYEEIIRKTYGLVPSTLEEDFIGIDAWDRSRFSSFSIRVRDLEEKMRSRGFGNELELEPWSWGVSGWEWGRDVVNKVPVDYVIFVPDHKQFGYVLNGAEVYDYLEQVLRSVKSGPLPTVKRWKGYVLGSELRFKRNAPGAGDQPKLLLYAPLKVFRDWIVEEFTL